MTDKHAPAAPAADPTDLYLREQQTFPSLDPEMVARLSAFGTRQQLAKGQMLFASGERGVDFFVILSGSVEIYDLKEHGEVCVVHVHDANE